MKFSKDQYVLRNFSKIQHKQWELYIITRIVHNLNDPEIEFVCQQLIKTSDGKRYLADLCFPSLKLYYEIDEAHHSSKKNKLKDEHRQREIIDATDFEEHRIKIFDKNNKDRNISEINNEVDQFINFIKKRKKSLIENSKFIAWNYENKFNPKIHIKRGYLDVEDNVVFLKHKDALKCFGYTGGDYQRATWLIKGTRKYVWFPKLYENKLWNNHLSEDFKSIIMKKKDNSKIERISKEEMIVFAHYKDLLGQIVYKFLGEFHKSKKKTDDYKWVFERRKTKIQLNQFKSL